VGACGAGMAGSEMQPYLEGGPIWGAACGGGWVGDAGSGDPAYRGAGSERRPTGVRFGLGGVL